MYETVRLFLALRLEEEKILGTKYSLESERSRDAGGWGAKYKRNMKTSKRSNLLVTALILLLSAGIQHSSTSSSSISPPFAYASDVAHYQSSTSQKKKNKLSHILNWGLAKVENIYDGKFNVKDLIQTFIMKCDHIVTFMLHSWIPSLTQSYTKLHTKEVNNLQKFDEEFRDLIKLRNKIDRKCLYSSSTDDRSICVANGMDIHNKIADLKKERIKSERLIDRYDKMMDWCKDYGNWFC